MFQYNTFLPVGLFEIKGLWQEGCRLAAAGGITGLPELSRVAELLLRRPGYYSLFQFQIPRFYLKRGTQVTSMLSIPRKCFSFIKNPSKRGITASLVASIPRRRKASAKNEKSKRRKASAKGEKSKRRKASAKELQKKQKQPRGIIRAATSY